MHTNPIFKWFEFFLGITNQFILCKKYELSNLYNLYIGTEQFCQESQYFAIFTKRSRVLPNIGLGWAFSPAIKYVLTPMNVVPKI